MTFFITHKHDQRVFVRFFSLLTSLVFFLTQFHFFFPEQTYASEQLPGQHSPFRTGINGNTQSVSATSTASARTQMVEIPSGLGKIQSRHAGTSRTRRPIILIQDAHAVPDAQQSIKGLVEYFTENYNSRFIALEGAEGDLDGTLIQSFPDFEAVRADFKNLIGRGEISGAAAACMESSLLKCRGMEHWKLYQQSVTAYREALRFQPAVLSRVEAIAKEIENWKRMHYSDAALRFESEFEELTSSRGPSFEKLDDVFKQFPSLPGDFKSLVLIHKAILLDRIHDRQSSDWVSDRFVRLQNLPLDSEEKKLLVQKIQLWKTGRIPDSEIGAFVTGMLLRHHVLQGRVPKKIIQSMRIRRQILRLDPETVRIEIQKLRRIALQSLLGKPWVSLWADVLDEFDALSALAHLEITPEMMESLKSRQSLKIPAAAEFHAIHEQIHLLAQSLLKQESPFATFYQIADRREQIFVRKIEKWSAETDAPLLLVAGGFHAQALSKALRERGYGVMLIAPAMREIPEQKLYSAYMQGEVSWAAYLASDPAASLFDAYHRGVRDRLLSRVSSRFERNRLLQAWRKSILYRLSSEQRIHKSGDYTKLVDEAMQGSSERTKYFEKLFLAQWKRWLGQIRDLEKNNHLSEHSISGLFKPSATQFPYAVAPFVRDLRMARARAKAEDPLAGTASSARSELRSAIPVAEGEDPLADLDLPGNQILKIEFEYALEQIGIIFSNQEFAETELIKPDPEILRREIDWSHTNLFDPLRIEKKIALTLTFRPDYLVRFLPEEYQCCGTENSASGERIGMPWRIAYTSGVQHEALLVMYGNKDTPAMNRAEGPVAYESFAGMEEYRNDRLHQLRLVAKIAKDQDYVRKGASSLRGAKALIIPKMGSHKFDVIADQTKSWVTAGISGHVFMGSQGNGMGARELDYATRAAYDIQWELDWREQRLALSDSGKFQWPLVQTVSFYTKAWMHPHERPVSMSLPPFSGVSKDYGGMPRGDHNVEGVAPMAALLALMRHPAIQTRYFGGKDFLDNPQERKLRVAFLGEGLDTAQIIDEIMTNPAHGRIEIVGLANNREEIYALGGRWKKPDADGEKPLYYQGGIDWGFFREFVRLRKSGDKKSLFEILDPYRDRHREIQSNSESKFRGVSYEKTQSDVLILNLPPHTFTLKDAQKFKGKVVLEARPSVADPWAVEELKRQGVLFIPFSTVNPGPAYAAVKELMMRLLEDYKYREIYQVMDGIIGYVVSNMWSTLDRLEDLRKEERADTQTLFELVENTNEIFSKAMDLRLSQIVELTLDWSDDSDLENYQRTLEARLAEITDDEDRERRLWIARRFIELVRRKVPADMARLQAVTEMVNSDYASGAMFGPELAEKKFKKLLAQTDSQNKYLRRETAYALGQIIFLNTSADRQKRRQAVAALRMLINDGYPRVRLEAIKAAGNLKDPELVNPLLERFLNPNETIPGVRRWLDWTLHRYGDMIQWHREVRKKEIERNQYQAELEDLMVKVNKMKDQLRQLTRTELVATAVEAYANADGGENRDENIRKATEMVRRMKTGQIIDRLVTLKYSFELQTPHLGLGRAWYQLSRLYAMRNGPQDAVFRRDSHVQAIEHYQQAQIHGAQLSAGAQLLMAEAFTEIGKPDEARKALISLVVPEYMEPIFAGARMKGFARVEISPLQFWSYGRMALEKMFMVDGFSDRTATFLTEEFNQYLMGRSLRSVMRGIRRKVAVIDQPDAAKSKDRTAAEVDSYRELVAAENMILKDVNQSGFWRRVGINEKVLENQIFYKLLILLSTGIYRHFPKLEDDLLDMFVQRKGYSAFSIHFRTPDKDAHIRSLFERLAQRSELRAGGHQGDLFRDESLQAVDYWDAGTNGTFSEAFYLKYTKVRVEADTQYSSRYVELNLKKEKAGLRINQVGKDAESDVEERIYQRLQDLNQHPDFLQFLTSHREYLKEMKIILLRADPDRKEFHHPHFLVVVNRDFQAAYTDIQDGRVQHIYLTMQAFTDFDLDLVSDILINQMRAVIARWRRVHSPGDAALMLKKEAAFLSLRLRDTVFVTPEISASLTYDRKIKKDYQIQPGLAAVISTQWEEISRDLPDFSPAATNYERALKFVDLIRRSESDASLLDEAFYYWGLITFEYRYLQALAQSSVSRPGDSLARRAKRMMELPEIQVFAPVMEVINNLFIRYVHDLGVYTPGGYQWGTTVGRVEVVENIEDIPEAFKAAEERRRQGDKEEIIWVLPYLPDSYDQVPGEGIIISVTDNRHAIDTAKEQRIPVAEIPNAVELLKGFHGKPGMLRVDHKGRVRFRDPYGHEKSARAEKKADSIQFPKAKFDGPLIYSLRDIDRHFVHYVGPKAATLGELALHGVPVPDARFLSFRFWNDFANHNGLHEKIAERWGRLKINDDAEQGRLETPDQEFEAILLEIKQLIEEAVFPEELVREIEKAVRQMQMDNGYPEINLAAQLNYIKTVFASKYNPKAARARIRFKVKDSEVIPAAILQIPVKARYAGNLYTGHDVSDDRLTMAVMASHGQGAAVVGDKGHPAHARLNLLSGLAESVLDQSWIDHVYELTGAPFLYTRSSMNFEDLRELRTAGYYSSAPDGKVPGSPIQTVPVTTQKRQEKILDEHRLRRLQAWGLRISEIFYLRPQDIEWAEEASGKKDNLGPIFFTQSREMINEMGEQDRMMEQAISDILARADAEELLAIKKYFQDKDHGKLLETLRLDLGKREIYRDKAAQSRRMIAAAYLAAFFMDADNAARVKSEELEVLARYLKNVDEWGLPENAVRYLLKAVRNLFLHSRDLKVKELIKSVFVHLGTANTNMKWHHNKIEIAMGLLETGDPERAFAKIESNLGNAKRHVDEAYYLIRVLALIPITYSGDALKILSQEHPAAWIRDYANSSYIHLEHLAAQGPEGHRSDLRSSNKEKFIFSNLHAQLVVFWTTLGITSALAWETLGGALWLLMIAGGLVSFPVLFSKDFKATYGGYDRFLAGRSEVNIPVSKVMPANLENTVVSPSPDKETVTGVSEPVLRSELRLSTGLPQGLLGAVLGKPLPEKQRVQYARWVARQIQKLGSKGFQDAVEPELHEQAGQWAVYAATYGVLPHEDVLMRYELTQYQWDRSAEIQFEAGLKKWKETIRASSRLRFSPILFYRGEGEREMVRYLSVSAEAFEEKDSATHTFQARIVIPSTLKARYLKEVFQKLPVQVRARVVNHFTGGSPSQMRLLGQSLSGVQKHFGESYGLFFVPKQMARKWPGLHLARSVDEEVPAVLAWVLVPYLSAYLAERPTRDIHAVTLKQSVPDSLAAAVAFQGTIRILPLLAELIAVQAARERIAVSA